MTYLFWFHTLEGRIELSNTATAAACARACAVARRGGAPPPRPFSSPLTRTSSSSSCARPAQKCGGLEVDGLFIVLEKYSSRLNGGLAVYRGSLTSLDLGVDGPVVRVM